jgi:hypothetical protein
VDAVAIQSAVISFVGLCFSEIDSRLSPTKSITRIAKDGGIAALAEACTGWRPALVTGHSCDGFGAAWAAAASRLNVGR